MLRHFEQLTACSSNHPPRRGVYPVITAQIARVMICDFITQLLAQTKLTSCDQTIKQFARMQHRVSVVAIGRILILEHIVGVRVGREDRFEGAFV